MFLSKSHQDYFSNQWEKSHDIHEQAGHYDRFIPVSPKIAESSEKTTQSQPFSITKPTECEYDHCHKIKSEKITYLDENNLEKTVTITPESAREFLLELKAADQKLAKNDIPSDSYKLRQKLFIIAGQHQKTAIASYHAFTLAETYQIDQAGKLIDLHKNNLDEFLSREEVWIPARREYHQAMIDKYLTHIKELSCQINTALDQSQSNQPNTIFMFRGNSCTGKSSTLKHKAFPQTDLNPCGFINPDTYKNDIKNDLLVNGKFNFYHNLIHYEGANIAYRLLNHPETQNLSIIYDRRNTKFDHYQDIKDKETKRPKEQRRNLVVFASDSPLELVLVRILQRDYHGNSPCVPCFALKSGHQEIRSSNLDIILDTQKHDWIDLKLYINHNQTNQGVTYDKKQLELFTKPRSKYLNLAAFNHGNQPDRVGEDKIIIELKDLMTALNRDCQSELDELERIIIDNQYIEQFIGQFGKDEITIAKLEEFIGQKLTEAADHKANRHDAEELDFDKYMQKIKQVLENTHLHNSVHKTELEEMNQNLKFDKVSHEIWNQTETSIADAKDLYSVINIIHQTYSEKNLQLDINASEFLCELNNRLKNNPIVPREIASYIEYHIGHKNVFHVEHPDTLGKLIASCFLVRMNHHQLPIRTLTKPPNNYLEYNYTYKDKRLG